MHEELIPPAKKARHNVFVKYLILLISFFGSIGFVNTLVTGAFFYQFKQSVTGEEERIEPESDSVPYENIEELKPSFDLRYYVLAIGFDLQVYQIVTEDGYVLELHRFVDPKHSEEDRRKRPPILMQHGLLGSSGGYVTGGRSSLAFYLHQAGYDVWLGNNRCGFEPKHRFYEGNLMHNEQYWDWDIRELAYYDLPCIIDNVLSHKPDHMTLSYVGHLQGCTQCYLMLRNSHLKEYHEKLNIFFQLAPAVFPGRLFHERAFIKFMHHRGRLTYQLIFGCCSFLRNLGQFRYLIGRWKLFRALSYMMYKYLFGWKTKHWNKHKKVWHFHFLFNLSYVSARLMNWWLSEWVPEGFSNQVLPHECYFNGENCAPTSVTPTKNGIPTKSYFPYEKSWFKLNEDDVVVPMIVFACGDDNLVDHQRLLAHLRYHELAAYEEGANLRIHELEGYDHLDVIYADNIKDTVASIIIETLEEFSSHRAPSKNTLNNIVNASTNEKVEANSLSSLPVASQLAVEA